VEIDKRMREKRKMERKVVRERERRGVCQGEGGGGGVGGRE
jgi:hypothetical protein